MASWYESDANGVVPRVGDLVAYNHSGNIAVGTIRRIGKSRTGRKIYDIMRTRPDEGRSTVRGGPQCLLVLQRPGP